MPYDNNNTLFTIPQYDLNSQNMPSVQGSNNQNVDTKVDTNNNVDSNDCHINHVDSNNCKRDNN